MTVFPGLLLAFLLMPGGSDRGPVSQSLAFFEPVRPARSLQVMAHRGGPHRAPEDIARALELAIADTFEWVEVDVRVTKDGQHVLLRGDRVGEKIGGTSVDAKDIAPEALVEVLKRHSLIDRAVVYQSAGYLEKLRAIEPAIRRMPPLRTAASLDSIAERVQPYAFDTNWTILSKKLIDRCHARGVKVFSDALGSHERVEDYQQAIRNGIDLNQTDYPVRVLRAIELLDPRN
jgi:glycerophosphoryl diester phosphodiesterase